MTETELKNKAVIFLSERSIKYGKYLGVEKVTYPDREVWSVDFSFEDEVSYSKFRDPSAIFVEIDISSEKICLYPPM